MDYAPVQGGEEGPAAPSTTAPASSVPKPTPALGFTGAGLAALGAILACIPVVITFVIGLVVLLAALVVSVIAVFEKNTQKWPSIVGIALSIVGGVIGSIVFSVAALVPLVDSTSGHLPTDFPTSITSEQPSDPSTSDDGEGRPSPETIGEGVRTLLHNDGMTTYDNVPGFYPCAGQYLYDSELSDAALQDTAAGIDVIDAERELAIQVAEESIDACTQ